MLKLRPYQRECSDAVIDGWGGGHFRRVLITLPCGAGKTVIFCDIIRRLRELVNLQHVMILAHRIELLEQAREKVRRAMPEARVAIECGDRYARRDTEIVVASVQTLNRPDCRRLWGHKFDLIIVDEAHHVVSAGHQRVLERFQPPLILGCTATAYRLDGGHLTDVFEAEAYKMGLREGIEQGWLAPIHCYRVVTGVDLGGVRSHHGDFAAGELAKKVNVIARTRAVLHQWQRVAGKRRTLAFCVSVEHAHDTAAAWRELGVTAEAVDGTMPKEKRHAVMNRFRSGTTQVLTNCELVTEGVDCPEIGAVVLLRPTQSKALLTQMVGRGTRLTPTKETCVLIDVVDNCIRHDVATAPSLFDLPDDTDADGRSLTDLVREREQRLAEEVWVPEVTQVELQRLELFTHLALPTHLLAHTRFAWSTCANGYALACGENRRARLVHANAEGHVLLLAHNRIRIGEIELGHDEAAALRQAEAHVEAAWPDCLSLVLREAAWRRRPASEGQVEHLVRQGLTPEVANTMTKGQASAYLDQRFARDY